MTVEYKPNARKGLRKIPVKDADRIMDGLAQVAAGDTFGLDIIPLRGREGFRLRVGKWRAIYDLESGKVVVLDITSRGQIYK